MIQELLSWKSFLCNFLISAVVVIIEFNINLSFLKLLQLLADGDVEINPGPTYKIVKSVHGTLNQADAKYGETSGMQCVPNALFAIIWSVIHKVSLWTSWDLDYILDNGDTIFKSLNTFGAISFDQLPYSITVEGTPVIVTFLNLISGEITLSGKAFLNFDGDLNGLMFMTGGFTTSIFLYKTQFFVFDSHSRSSDGSVVADGHSLLMKFKRLCDVEAYIRDFYLHKQSLTSQYYIPDTTGEN